MMGWVIEGSAPDVFGADVHEAVRLIAAVYAERAPYGLVRDMLDGGDLSDGDLAFYMASLDLTPAERACGEALAALTPLQRVAAVGAYRSLHDGD